MSRPSSAGSIGRLRPGSASSSLAAADLDADELVAFTSDSVPDPESDSAALLVTAMAGLFGDDAGTDDASAGCSAMRAFDAAIRAATGQQFDQKLLHSAAASRAPGGQRRLEQRRREPAAESSDLAVASFSTRSNSSRRSGGADDARLSRRAKTAVTAPAHGSWAMQARGRGLAADAAWDEGRVQALIDEQDPVRRSSPAHPSHEILLCRELPSHSLGHDGGGE